MSYLEFNLTLCHIMSLPEEYSLPLRLQDADPCPVRLFYWFSVQISNSRSISNKYIPDALSLRTFEILVEVKGDHMSSFLKI